MKTTLPTYLFNILFPIKKEAIMPWEDTQGNPLDYNQKQCIKSPQTRQINSSTSPFRFHADPGLHLLHTRISHALPPGSEETFQVVFHQKVACLHEKTSLFNLFCISFRIYLKFDRGDTCKSGIQGVERERYIWYKSFFAKQLSYYHN